MKTKRKTPEIRFKGFVEAWEQRKLSELAQTYVGGGTPSTKIAEYWGGDIPWIQSSDILIDDVHSVNYTKKITKKALENSSAKFIPAGSLAIITRVGVGKLALVPFDYATSQDFISFVELNENPIYLQYQMYLLLNKLKHTLQGTSIKGITNKELLSNKVKVPINDEQNKIGELFKNIDKTITLHQRKLQQLKEVKRGMLFKMFAEKTKSKPSVRLSGFDGLWEQTRYNAIVNYESSSFSRNEFPDEISETGYPVFDANNLVARIGQYDQGNNYISILKDGAGVGRLSLREGKSSVIGTMGYIVPKEVDVYFLYYLTKNIKFTKYINGSTIPHLYFKDYGEEKVKFAKDLKEQEEVGRFFQKLDRVIELQEREIELLEETKKGFLQKMFV